MRSIRTFEKAVSMTGWTTGSNNGIPSNWTVVNGKKKKKHALTGVFRYYN